MGLGVWLFSIAVILITVLLLCTLLSPDNWGQASGGCNQNCCNNSCATSCGLSSSPNGGPKAKSLNRNLVQKVKDQSEPYALPFNIPLWKRYVQEKENAKKTHFSKQYTWTANTKRLMNRWKVYNHVTN